LISACSGAPPQTATAQSGASLGQLDRSLRLNIVAFDLTPDIAQLVPGLRNPRGVLVGRVAEGSPLAAGDIILRINDTPTGDLSHLKGVLARIPERDPVVATVERASLVRYVVLEN
jgi:S1-C subfamily serine protease